MSCICKIENYEHIFTCKSCNQPSKIIINCEYMRSGICPELEHRPENSQQPVCNDCNDKGIYHDQINDKYIQCRHMKKY